MTIQSLFATLRALLPQNLISDLIQPIVSCLRMGNSVGSEQDLRDGKTDTSDAFYQTFEITAKIIMNSLLKLPWTWTLVAWYYNPYWFLGMQLVYLLIYFEGVYRPYNMEKDYSKGLKFESFSRLPKDKLKQEGQVRFLFIFLGLFGLDQVFPSWRNGMHDWLFSPKNQSSSLLKKMMLLTLTIFDRLSQALSCVYFQDISKHLLQSGAVVGLHLIALHAYYTVWILQAPSSAIYCTLVVSSITLLNFYKLLSPSISNIRFKMGSIADLFIPLFSTDLSQIVSTTLSLASYANIILSNISNKLNNSSLKTMAYCLNSLPENFLPFKIARTVYNLLGTLYSLLFSSSKTQGVDDKKENEFVSLINYMYNLSGSFAIWSDMVVSWKLQNDKLPEKKPFCLNPNQLKSLDPHSREQWLQKVWRPHLDDFLQMDTMILPQSDPYVAKPLIGSTKVSPDLNVLGLNPSDRIFGNIDSQGYSTRDPLRWNRSTFRKSETAPRSSESLDTDRIYQWFIDNVKERDADQLLHREAVATHQEVFEDTRGRPSLRFTVLKEYMAKAYECRKSRASAINTATEERFTNQWAKAHRDFQFLIKRISQTDSNSRQEDSGLETQLDMEKRDEITKILTKSILALLENSKKCPVALLGVLDEISEDLDQLHQFSSIQSSYVKTMRRVNEWRSQEIAHNITSSGYTQRFNNLSPIVDIPQMINDLTNDRSVNTHSFAQRFEKCIFGRHEPPYLSRYFESSGYLMSPFSPSFSLLNLANMVSATNGQLEPNDRHMVNICSALIGEKIENSQNSDIERNALNSWLPLLEAVNINALHDSLPTGYQLNSSFHDLEAPFEAMPHSFFTAGSNLGCPFYHALKDMLKTSGYLQESDSEAQIRDALYDLINTQVDLSKSPLRVYAVIQCLTSAKIMDPSIIISWKTVATCIHSLDNGNPNAFDIDQSDLNEALKSMLNFFLHDPRDTLQKMREAFKELDGKPSRLSQWQVHSYKTRCFISEDNIEILSRIAETKASSSASIFHNEHHWHTKHKSWLDGNKKAYLEFLMNPNQECTDLTLLPLIDCDDLPIYSKEQLYLAYNSTNPTCGNMEQLITDHFYNQVVMPIMLTLFLQEGIMYRGAEYNEPNRSDVYQNAQDVKKTREKRSESAKERMLPSYYIKKAFAFLVYLATSIFPVVSRELGSLLLSTTKQITLLAIGCVTTFIYYIPYGIYREGYIGKLFSLQLSLIRALGGPLYQITPSPIKKILVDPFLKAINWLTGLPMQLARYTNDKVLQPVIKFILNFIVFPLKSITVDPALKVLKLMGSGLSFVASKAFSGIISPSLEFVKSYIALPLKRVTVDLVVKLLNLMGSGLFALATGSLSLLDYIFPIVYKSFTKNITPKLIDALSFFKHYVIDPALKAVGLIASGLFFIASKAFFMIVGMIRLTLNIAAALFSGLYRGATALAKLLALFINSFRPGMTKGTGTPAARASAFNQPPEGSKKQQASANHPSSRSSWYGLFFSAFRSDQANNTAAAGI